MDVWSPLFRTMFFRVKPAKGYRYLQIARSVRRGKTVRQEIIATLGRLDVLRASGQLESLMRSGLRFSEKIRVLDAHAAGETQAVALTKIGPDLVFGRLWKSMGFEEIVGDLAAKAGTPSIWSGRFISRFCTGSLPRAVTVRRKRGRKTIASPGRKSFRCTSFTGRWVAGRGNRAGGDGQPALHEGLD